MSSNCDYEYLLSQWGYKSVGAIVTLTPLEEEQALKFLEEFIGCASKYKPYKVPFVEALIKTYNQDIVVEGCHYFFQKLLLNNLTYLWI